MKVIEYYFWINSDWAYLGADRLEQIAKRHEATILYRPVDLPYVYSQTGGIVLQERAKERQAYRIAELKRWSRRLNIQVNPTPRFMCPNGDLASCMVIAADKRRLPVAPLYKEILAAQWCSDLDISNPETLFSVAKELGLDGESLLEEAQQPSITATYRKYTELAIKAGVFGSPSYVYQGELFWGQDRLDFLDEAIAAANKAAAIEA